MLAGQTTLRTLLEGTKQYRAPLYQRRYSWRQSEWEGLWKNVLTQYELFAAEESSAGDDERTPTHFLGSFVLAPVPGPARTPARQHIVDGQQRLTTLFALLAALRDILARIDETQYERFNNLYLHNQYQKGEDRWRLVLTEHDRASLNALVGHYPAQPESTVGAAYRFFLNRLEGVRIQQQPVDLEHLEEVILDRLVVVEITAQQDDNVHRIFQTLNSTGVALDQVDLLRNHVFMLLPRRGDTVFREVWQPMEKTLGVRDLDFFLWADLIRAGYESTNRDAVYNTWREKLEPFEQDEEAVEQELRGLQKRSREYEKILDPAKCGEENIELRLRRLKEWGTNTVNPILLLLLLRHDDGAPAQDVARAMLHLESYLVRRLVASIPTNNLNRIFSSLPGQLSPVPPLSDAIRDALSGGRKYWPTDADVRAKCRTEDFYGAQRAHQRQFVLRRIEEHLVPNERPDWEATNITIEHVMPRNLSEEWLDHLIGTEEDPMEAHRQLLHTLGNLTLTGYNPQLSNHHFQRKQQIYEQSRLEMNRRLLEHDTWGREEINKRADFLAECIVDIWPGPLPGAAGAVSDEPDWERVESALTALEGGQWTNYEALTDLLGIPLQNVVLEARGGRLQESDRFRVLRSDGGVDAEAPWVSANVAAHLEQLLGLGIIESREDPRGVPDNYMGPQALLRAIGEED